MVDSSEPTIYFEKLTASFVLEHVRQEEVIAKFAHMSVARVEELVRTKEMFCSFLRIDHSPTCVINTHDNGRLWMYDFGGFFSGDMFDIVGDLHNIPSRDPRGFNVILNLIAEKFKIHNYSMYDPKAQERIEKVKKRREVRNRQIGSINFEVRSFNSYDKAYWSQFGLSEAVLKYHNVYPANRIWYNGKELLRNKNPKQPAKFGHLELRYVSHVMTKDGIPIYEIYRPFNVFESDGYIRKVKFITNKSTMKGLPQLKFNSPNLIITKSLKDVMCLRLVFKTLGIDAEVVGLASESVLPTAEQINFFRSKGYKNIYTLFDNDRAGMASTIKCRSLYATIPLVMPGIFNKHGNFNAKDFSDYIKVTKDRSVVKDFVAVVVDYLNNKDHYELYEFITHYGY